jgi:hypothetical protein
LTNWLSIAFADGLAPRPPARAISVAGAVLRRD